MKFDKTITPILKIFNLFIFSVISTLGFGQTTETFNTPGTGTFMVPAGVTSIEVEVWGAGGGGGAPSSSSSLPNFGGGGGGGYAKSTITVTPGNTFNYTVGQGGGSSSDGEDSVFDFSIIGGGGTTGTDTTGGSGGIGSGGSDYNFNGGVGGIPNSINRGGYSGGGGSSAGVGGDGGDAIERIGGIAPACGGEGGDGGKNAIDNSIPTIPATQPTTGNQPGGGGGGGIEGGVGASGGDGKVKITYTDPCDIASGNPDSDGDGVTNLCDLDDDNDGILDVNEQTPNFVTSPQAIWNFNKSLNDSSNTYNPTATGNTPTFNTDAIESCYSASFNGSQQIKYGVSGGFMTQGTSQISFSAWIKPDDLTGNRIIYEEGGSSNGVALWLNDDKLTFTTLRSSRVNVEASEPLIENNWHHVAATFDSGVLKVYLDGVSASTTTGGSYTSIANHDDGGGNSGIGGKFNTTAIGVGEANFSGLMDAVRYSSTTVFSEQDIIDENVFTDINSDGDGIVNRLDLDSDNDGAPDIIEAGGVDTTNDGRVDNNTDTNSDGWADVFDPIDGGTPLLDLDTDEDCAKDRIDLDADNDGILDIIEAGGVDTDNDGIVDGTFVDGDNDGWSNVFDSDNGGTALPDTDTDSDAIPNRIDLDSDADDCPDALEGDFGFSPSDLDTNNTLSGGIDSNGIPTITGVPQDIGTAYDDTQQADACDPCNVASGNPDTDGDGVTDVCDLDYENDGVLNTDEISNNCSFTYYTSVEAYWPLDGDTDDASGNGNNENGSVSVTYTTDAIQGSNSIDFNTTNPIRYSQDGGFMETEFTNLSISAWIKPKVFSGNQILFDEGGGTNGATLWLDGSTLTFSTRDGSPKVEVTHPTDLKLDVWQHVAATFDNGELLVYLNGVASSPASAVYDKIPNHGDNGGIGGQVGGGNSAGVTGNFTGLMDAVRYSNSVSWSAEDINNERTSCDTDEDGVANSLDLDSDNDGIFDAVEAGAGLTDLESDGSFTSGVDSDGIPIDAVGGLTPADTDSDGNTNPFDLDSDDDGCSDTNEYYEDRLADGDDDDVFGIGTPTVDVNGLVVAAGYDGEGIANVIDITVSRGCYYIQDKDGNWNIDANWLNASAPSSTDNAFIKAQSNIIQNQIINNLSLDINSQVDINNGFSLEVKGNITNDSQFVGDGEVILNGTTNQELDGDGEYENLKLDNANGATVISTTVINGILYVDQGTFTTNDATTFPCDFDATNQPVGQIGPVDLDGSISGDVTVEQCFPARRAFRFVSASTTGGSIHDNWQEGANAWDDAGVPNNYGTHITGVEHNDPNSNPPQSLDQTNGLDWQPSGNASMFKFNSTTDPQSWEPVLDTNTPTLTAGDAYRLLIRGARKDATDGLFDITDNTSAPTDTKLRSTGTVLKGDVIISPISPGLDNEDYALIGNPFQAIVDMDQVLAGNTGYTKLIYVFDPNLGGAADANQDSNNIGGRGGFVTVDVTNGNTTVASGLDISTTDANQFLQPYQAVFVQATSNTSITPGDIVFKENDKNVNEIQTDVFSTTPQSRIYVTLFDEFSFDNQNTPDDGLVIYFSSEETNLINDNDAIKFINQDESIARHENNNLLSFENRAMPQDDEVLELFIDRYRTTNYKLEIGVDQLPEYNVYLYDNYLESEIAINNNDYYIYSFNVDSSIAESVASDRFEIRFDSSTFSTNDFDQARIAIYPNPVQDRVTLNLSQFKGKANQLSIFDVTGKLIDSYDMYDKDSFEIDMSNYANGLYILKIETELGLLQHKLIKE